MKIHNVVINVYDLYPADGGRVSTMTCR